MKHSVHSAVVLDPVLSDAVHRRGEPHLTQLTWQQLMERYIHTIGSPSLIQSIRKYENNGYSIFQRNFFLKGLYTTINFYPRYHSSGKSSLRFHNMQRHHWIPYFSPAILIAIAFGGGRKNKPTLHPIPISNHWSGNHGIAYDQERKWLCGSPFLQQMAQYQTRNLYRM